jgi:hypothetical protein
LTRKPDPEDNAGEKHPMIEFLKKIDPRVYTIATQTREAEFSKTKLNEQFQRVGSDDRE